MDGITDSMDTNLSKLWETVKGGKPGMLQSMRFQGVGHDLATEPPHDFSIFKIYWDLLYDPQYVLLLVNVACILEKNVYWGSFILSIKSSWLNSIIITDFMSIFSSITDKEMLSSPTIVVDLSVFWWIPSVF